MATKQHHIPNTPSPETLQALLEAFVYDPDTGEIRHSLNRPRSHFTTDRGYKIWLTKATKSPVVGRVNVHGRVQIDFTHPSLAKKMKYYRYHLAWLHTTNKWPTNCLDHINGNPSDDRIENLRCVNHYENMHNLSSHSALGIGVYANGNGYRAKIDHDKTRHHLGSFLKPSHGRLAADIGYLLIDHEASSGPNGLSRKDLDRAIALLSPRLRLEKLLSSIETNNPLPLQIAAE